METRLITLADAPILAALHNQSFGASCWSLAQITDSLKVPTTEGWIAPAEGATQGFILCQSTLDEMEILTFCVAAAARRKGLGTDLLDAALTAARQKNIRRVFLEVAADNEAALALYEKNAFKKAGRRPAYYRHNGNAVDAITLTLAFKGG